MLGFFVFAVILILTIIILMIYDAHKLEKELDKQKSRHSNEKEKQI